MNTNHHLMVVIVTIILVTITVTSGQEVKAKCGTIKGKEVEYLGKKVHQFLGVPYAEAPVGELRFRPPKAKAPFAAPFEAMNQPPLCPQIDPDNFKGAATDAAKKKGVDPMAAQQQLTDQLKDVKITGGALAMGEEFKKMKDLKGVEDCLFLNIFSPATKAAKPRAVVIFFHGGIFYAGGIGVPSFDGSVLATTEDIIVVTVQFRLGVYGFLFGGTKEMPGNLGLRDQLQGMKWVKENIAAFGGDPKLVTIMGGNSGGWSVGFHLMSPLSAGFFKRAIMESGSTLSPLMLFGENAAKARFEKFAVAAGCTMGAKANPKDPFSPPNAGTYDCLAKLDKAKVDAAQAKMMTGKKDIGFLPSEDSLKGVCFFCQNPFDWQKEMKIPKGQEIMLGTNSNEGGMFLSSGLKDIYPPFKGEPQKKDLNALVEYAKKSGAGSNAGQMQMMLPMFFRNVDKKNPVAVRNRLLELIADGMFVCPDQMLVQAFAKKGIAWYYRFDYRASKSYWNTWLEGALHMDEHQFVWGIPFREDAKANYNDADRTISKLMMDIWGAFIKTGKPELDKKWKWKPNKGKDKGHVHITAKGAKGVKGFPKNSCKDLTRYYSMGRSFLKNFKPS